MVLPLRFSCPSKIKINKRHRSPGIFCGPCFLDIFVYNLLGKKFIHICVPVPNLLPLFYLVYTKNNRYTKST